MSKRRSARSLGLPGGHRLPETRRLLVDIIRQFFPIIHGRGGDTSGDDITASRLADWINRAGRDEPHSLAGRAIKDRALTPNDITTAKKVLKEHER